MLLYLVRSVLGPKIQHFSPHCGDLEPVGFHHLGTENRSGFLLTCAANHLPHHCTNFGRLGKAAAVAIDPKVPIVSGVEIGTDWTGTCPARLADSGGVNRPRW